MKTATLLTLGVAGLATAAASAPALADLTEVLASDALTLKAGVDASYDSNLFRVPDDVDPEPFIGTDQRSDRVDLYSTGATLSLPLGLQKVRLEGEATRSDYHRFTFLDHTAWKALGRWDWVYGRHFSGRLGASSQRVLESFTEFRDPVLDLVDVNQRDASVQWQPGERAGLRAAYRQRRREHGLDARATADLEQDIVSAGAFFLGRAGGEVGTRVSYERGEFPNREYNPGDLLDDAYRQYRAVGTAAWATARSRTDFELGYARREHDNLDARDFGGVVGQLATTYAISPDTRVRLTAGRRVGALRDLFSSSVIASSLDAAWLWDIGHRTTFTLFGNFEHRAFQDDGLVSDPDGDLPREKVWTAGVRLDWQIRRYLTLSVGGEHGWRDSTRAGFDYDYNAFMVSLRGAL